MSQLFSNLVLSQDIDMVFDSVKAMFNLNNNFNEIRDYSLDLSIYRPRLLSLSLSVSKCDEEYHVCIQRESDKIIKDKSIILSNNFELEYMTPKSQTNQVSKVAEPSSNMKQQYALTVGPTLNQMHGKDMVNI